MLRVAAMIGITKYTTNVTDECSEGIFNQVCKDGCVSPERMSMLAGKEHNRQSRRLAFHIRNTIKKRDHVCAGVDVERVMARVCIKN